MRRREFVAALGTAAAWPLAARAQQPTPVVGFLASTSAAPSAERVSAFRQGLAETGFIEPRDVAIEYRSAEGRYERLPALAAELVRLPVAVLAASGITAARVAQATTAKVPIVFNTGGDPVRLGLVTSLNKPETNLTGVATLGKVLVAKQLELLRELVPDAALVAFLVNPNNAVSQEEISDARAAAGALGRKLLVVEAGRERPATDAPQPGSKPLALSKGPAAGHL
jgi:putative ABC transport system substrate-binding protein